MCQKSFTSSLTVYVTVTHRNTKHSFPPHGEEKDGIYCWCCQVKWVPYYPLIRCLILSMFQEKDSATLSMI